MDKEQQVEWARRYLVHSNQSMNRIPYRRPLKRGGMQSNTWEIPTGEREAGKEFWESLPYRILAASPHLQGISGHEEILDKLLESMPLLEALEILEGENRLND